MDGQMSLWEEVPVNRSASPEEERAWTASLVSCSSTSELWQRFARHGFSGRTCPESLTLETMLSPNFSGKFKTSGMAASHGEFLTLNSSEWPSGADVCFLSDVLERGGVPQRYSLSPRACAGILRRASKRGKSLPELLGEALSRIAAEGV